MKKGKNFSANNVNGLRKKSDFYETPYSMTEQFLETELFDKTKTILEPSCGKKAIVKVLNNHWEKELVEGRDLVQTGHNFLECTNSFNYIITNPPFSLAFEFIIKAKQIATDKFALLLPLSYLHGKQRHDYVYSDKNYGLETVHVFTRYPMLGDALREDGKYKTGMMVYAWFVWSNGFYGNPNIKWIDNHKNVLGARPIKPLKNQLELL